MLAKILIQLDVDPHPSTFDSVVALDGGADHLLRHGGVTEANVTPLVHGAMFTRGGAQLKSTAIFVGGTDIVLAEKVYAKVQSCFFGPVRVSTLFDANGCNTTAAAAVVMAMRHLDLTQSLTVVLGGTGPVGRRVAEMIAVLGGRVRIASRSISRAEEVAEAVVNNVSGGQVQSALLTPGREPECLTGADAVIACGAAGIRLVDAATLNACESLRVAIDLNAVPPAGLESIGSGDKAVDRAGRVDYGAIGVGGLKMKVHVAAIASLFEQNDRNLGTREVLEIAQRLSRTSEKGTDPFSA